MKLSPRVDLDAVRATAIVAVDAHFGRALPGSGTMDRLYAAKTDLARRTRGDDPMLRDEAARRGLAYADLAALIIAKNDEATAALLAHEAARQAVKNRIAVATDEHAIRAIVLEVTR